MSRIEDGGHVYLRCRQCRAALVDIWIVQPREPFKWKGKANCPFCGDRSFTVTWQGLFQQGGCGHKVPGSEVDNIDSTVVEDVLEDGGDLVFVVRKASANARPIK